MFAYNQCLKALTESKMKQLEERRRRPIYVRGRYQQAYQIIGHALDWINIMEDGAEN